MLNVEKIVGNILSSNSYLLFEDGYSDCFLVDVGDAGTLLKALPENLNVKGIFLTHSHFDHIAGINTIIERFPNSLVYTSEYGKKALGDAKKNFSYYHETPVAYQGENVIVLSEGNSVKLFDDVVLRVMATPGHCPSCLTYYTNDYIFTGDSYIPGVAVVTKLPLGERKEAEKSLERILHLAKERKILAGHTL